MENLLECIKELQGTNVRKIIDERINEFKKIGKCSKEIIFNELCYCILTANYNAERSIKIQNNIGKGFLELPEKKLAEKLKRLGHRFPNARAKYIIEARKQVEALMKALSELRGDDLRKWLVNNVKGVGMKEASHFLRNIGFFDYAIIDFHIVDLLVKYGLINPPKTITKNKYLEIEKVLRIIGNKTNLTLGELDLCLWYLETGKVLK